MKTGWETEEFTPGLKAGAWESSAVMPTHTEFRPCVKSVKIRRKSLICNELSLQVLFQSLRDMLKTLVVKGRFCIIGLAKFNPLLTGATWLELDYAA